MHESMSLKYEPASEPLHISVEWLYLGCGVDRGKAEGELLGSHVGRDVLPRRQHPQQPAQGGFRHTHPRPSPD